MAPSLFDSQQQTLYLYILSVPGLCAFRACKEETSSIDRRERPGGWRCALNGLLCFRNSPWSLPWECIDRWVTSALPRPLLLLLRLFSSALVQGTTNEYPPTALILGTNWIELMVSGCCPAGCVSFHPLNWIEPKRSECYVMLCSCVSLQWHWIQGYNYPSWLCFCIGLLKYGICTTLDIGHSL